MGAKTQWKEPRQRQIRRNKDEVSFTVMANASSRVSFPAWLAEGLWKFEDSVKEAFQINREHRPSALGHLS